MCYFLLSCYRALPEAAAGIEALGADDGELFELLMAFSARRCREHEQNSGLFWVTRS
jgi:hypothetical protein